jgi:hypothetical protein
MEIKEETKKRLLMPNQRFVGHIVAQGLWGQLDDLSVTL